MAKDLICKNCDKKWYVDEELFKQVKLCPFCAAEYIHEKEKIIIDSVDKAIYATICEAGIEILLERNRFLAYLNDMASDYRKEIKILSKACEPKILSAILEASKQEYADAVITMKTVEVNLIDDEGMSDKWAEMICEWFLKAIHPKYEKKEKKLIVLEENEVKNEESEQVKSILPFIPSHANSASSATIEKIKYPEIANDMLSNWVKKQKSKTISLNQLVITGEKYTIAENEYSGQKFSWLILGNNVKVIGKNAFSNCGIQMIYIPASVEIIEDYAFSNNNINFVVFEDTSLTQKISPSAFNNYPTNSYEHFRDASIACSKDNSKIKRYCTQNRHKQQGFGPTEKAFISYARSLIGQLPISKIDDYSLLSALKLKSETGIVNNLIISDQKYFDNGFDYRYNDNFNVLIIKNTTEVPPCAFEGCRNLKYVIMDSSVEKIGANAFRGCVGLKFIVFSGKNSKREIADNAFEFCDSLEYFSCCENDFTLREYCSRHRLDCKIYDQYVGAAPKQVKELKMYAHL